MSKKAENMNTFIEKVFYPVEKEDHKKADFIFLKNMKLSDSECVYLVDLTQNKILYKKGFLKYLQFDEDITTFDFFFKHIHPDDLEIVQRISRNTILYGVDHPDKSSRNQLLITYRQKTNSGDYIKILNQSTVFKVNEKGILQSVLIRLLDISFLDSTDNVNWEYKASGLDNKIFKNKIYKYTKRFFTTRERELILVIIKGYTNKQIGKQLNISEHTVSTHRKNILKKSGCHNFIELEIFCKGKGIL